MKHDYTKLDAAILARITALGCVVFTRLQAGDVIKIANAHSEAEADDEPCTSKLRLRPAWRFIDARLQVLRKAGLITYQRKPEGWVLTNPEGGKKAPAVPPDA